VCLDRVSVMKLMMMMNNIWVCKRADVMEYLYLITHPMT